MTRGTTPTYTIKFQVTVDFEDVEVFYLTLKQSEKRMVTKKIPVDDPAVNKEERTVEWTLTQMDTLKFKEGEAELQVRGKFTDNTAFATKVMRVPVNRVLDDEVI